MFYSRFLLFLIVGFLGLTFCVDVSARQAAIFKLSDPLADDYGDGSLVYPLRDDMEPGDLDLQSLEAYPEKDGTLFIATFARAVRVPGFHATDASGTTVAHYARFGFYTFNLDIYVDTDRVPGSGNQFTLPGRKVEVDRHSAWERAVVLTPRPYEARILIERFLRTTAENEMRQSKMELSDEDKDRIKKEARKIAGEQFFFPTRIRVFGRTIQFFVPKNFLQGHARIDWSYAVAVSGADLVLKTDFASLLGFKSERPTNMMVMPVIDGRSTQGFGQIRNQEHFRPPIIDIIVPQGVRQEDTLRSYDASIKIRGVVPAEQ